MTGPARPRPEDAAPGQGLRRERRSGLRRRRTLGLFLLLGLAALTMVALLTTNISTTAVTEQIDDRIAGAARQTSEYLDQVLAGQATILATAASRPAIMSALQSAASGDPGAVQTELDSVIRVAGHATGVILTTAEGNPVAAAGASGLTRPADFQAGWRSQLQHGGFLAAGPHRNGRTTISIVVPVMNGSNSTVTGFLVEQYDLAGAQAGLGNFVAAQAMSLTVLDRDGNLIIGLEPAASGQAAVALISWTSVPVISQRVTSTLANHDVEIDNASRGQLAAYSRLSSGPWVVRAALSNSALAPINDLRLAAFTVTAALALLFIAGVNLLNRALRRQEETEKQLLLQAVALEHVAMHDPLTGLPNRLLFTDRLQQSLTNARRNGKKMSLFILDLDGFKELNDALGHEAGDTLLKETAARLQASVRASDTVARLGGDEFVIVTVDAGREEAELVGTKITERMKEPVHVEGGGAVAARISMGVAVFPEDGQDSPALLRKADSNMYADKRSVKGRRAISRFDNSEPARFPRSL